MHSHPGHVQQYTYNTRTIHVQCTYNTRTMHVQYTYNARTIHVQYTYNTRTMHVQYTYNARTIHVQYTYNTRTIHVQYTYNTRTIHVPIPYKTRTKKFHTNHAHVTNPSRIACARVKLRVHAHNPYDARIIHVETTLLHTFKSVAFLVHDFFLCLCAFR
jgi:ABC-type microcin C transport system permease subunit YejE